MKKALSALALCLGLAAVLPAQSFQNIIKTNPFGLAFGNLNATYERVIGTSSSVLVSTRYLYRFLGAKVSTIGFEAGYRYYFTHNRVDVPTGFYIYPFLGFSSGRVREEDLDKISYGTFTFGAEVGYQWAWDSGFALDLGLGPVMTSLLGKWEEADFDVPIPAGATFPLPSLTIAIGYSF